MSLRETRETAAVEEDRVHIIAAIAIWDRYRVWVGMKWGKWKSEAETVPDRSYNLGEVRAEMEVDANADWNESSEGSPLLSSSLRFMQNYKVYFSVFSGACLEQT